MRLLILVDISVSGNFSGDSKNIAGLIRQRHSGGVIPCGDITRQAGDYVNRIIVQAVAVSVGGIAAFDSCHP